MLYGVRGASPTDIASRSGKRSEDKGPMNIIRLLVEVDELRLAIIQAITCCVAFKSHIHHSEPQSWWLLRMLDDYIGEYME